MCWAFASSGGSSCFQVLWALLVVLSPFSASSWGLATFYLVASSRCPCLWGPSFAHFKWPGFVFSLAFGHLVSSPLPLSFFFFYSSYSCVGVDNALIKGENANTRFINPCDLICDEWLIKINPWHRVRLDWLALASARKTTCLLACGAQVWSSEAVADGEVKVK